MPTECIQKEDTPIKTVDIIREADHTTIETADMLNTVNQMQETIREDIIIKEKIIEKIIEEMIIEEKIIKETIIEEMMVIENIAADRSL